MVSEALPAGWKLTALGAVAGFINGDRSENYPTQADRAQSGVPFINTGHIEPTGRLTTTGMEYITRESFNRLRSGKVRPGDIVYCLRGSTIGKTARNHFAEGAIASSLVIVRAKEHCCQEYLYFYLTSPLGQKLVTQHDNGSAQPNLSVRVLSNYVLPLPPFPEQRAIAHILSTLDDKIELNRRMNETLETTASAIFKSWFVDSAPVQLQVNGGSTAGINADLVNVFPAKLSQEDNHQNPVGRKVGSVYELADVIYGAPFASKFFNSEQQGLPLIRIRDLTTHKPEIYTVEQHPKKTVIKAGDIIVGMDGEFRVHLWCGPEGLLNQRVCSFKPKQNVPRFFVAEALRAPLSHFENSKTGTTVIHLGKADIDTFRISIPTEPVLKAFAKITEPMVDRILVNAAESQTLADLRDALLPKLVSGEIRIKQAEKLIEAHA